MKLRAGVALLLGILGCTAPRPASVPPAPLPKPQATVPAPPPSQPAPRVFDESLLHGKEFLLEASAALVPEARDPVVGRLSGDKEMVAAIQELFQAADTGSLLPGALVPRWADYLQGWAKRFQGSLGKSSVRVGEPLKESDLSLMVPVRLFGGTKEYSGWVVLERQGTTVLASDVQITSVKPRVGPLDPESPDQPISSPIRR